MAHNEFDERAKTWDANPERAQRAANVAACITAAIDLQEDMTILEYGCGTGVLGLLLKPRLGKLILADVSEGMLDVVREKLAALNSPQISAMCLDLSDPNWQDHSDLPHASVDMLVTTMVLHHVQDIDTVLSGFAALVRPGGHLFISDLDLENGFHGAGASVHHEGFDRAELAGRVSALGFRLISETTAFTIHKAGRSFPVFLLGFVKQ